MLLLNDKTAPFLSSRIETNYKFAAFVLNSNREDLISISLLGIFLDFLVRLL